MEIKRLINNKTQLKRLLALEVCLAVGGIILMSCLYLYSVGQQQRVTEKLFGHPFAVSNAALEFRIDVLVFRKYMLETMLTHKQLDDTDLAMIRHFEEQMDNHLAIIRRDFLGDKTRVNNIMLEMDAWRKIRDLIKTDLIEGDIYGAQNLALQQASLHIEQILVDTDYVISFARSKALSFVEEGRTELIKSRLLLALLAFLSLVTYIMLSLKLRQGIYKIYDREAHDATFDELTGAHNHRSFIKLGEAEIKRARRHGQNLSILMMDLDHFKNVNDSHGHDAGDSVLRLFGSICMQNLREEDLLGRIGGEEFAILLPLTDVNGAIHIAERIRQEVASSNFKVAEGKHLNVTVSIGVATLDDNIITIGNLLKRADQALYRSKNGGRNMVSADPAMKADRRDGNA